MCANTELKRNAGSREKKEIAAAEIKPMTSSSRGNHSNYRTNTATQDLKKIFLYLKNISLLKNTAVAVFEILIKMWKKFSSLIGWVSASQKNSWSIECGRPITQFSSSRSDCFSLNSLLPTEGKPWLLLGGPGSVSCKWSRARLLFQDVQALGLLAGNWNCGYSSRS